MKRNFRQLVTENSWLKKIPNALTICNSLCGFSAILYTLRVYEKSIAPETVLATSAWIILFAMFFDALDGFAARIFNAASMHGLQMDSLSDMVTFGVAPAVVVAVMAHRLRDSLSQYQFVYIWIFCAVYLGCAALRLATYNVHAILEKKSGDRFSGLPSPGAAAAVCTLVIYYSFRSGEINQIVQVLPIYAAVLGLLMVSNIPYTHIGKWIQSVRRNKKRLIVLVIVLVCLWMAPELTLVVVVNAYIMSGPVIALGTKIGVLKPPIQPSLSASVENNSESQK